MPTELAPEDEAKWRRRLASSANNRAWALSEQASRTPDEDDEMLHAAHASAHLWSTIGNEHNAALAKLLLGQVHALLGLAPTAARYAGAARRFFVDRPSAAWELALAYAVSAHAAVVNGDARRHATEYADARRAADAVADDEEREIVFATLRTVPKPAATEVDRG